MFKLKLFFRQGEFEGSDYIAPHHLADREKWCRESIAPYLLATISTSDLMTKHILHPSQPYAMVDNIDDVKHPTTFAEELEIEQN